MFLLERKRERDKERREERKKEGERTNAYPSEKQEVLPIPSFT